MINLFLGGFRKKIEGEREGGSWGDRAKEKDNMQVFALQQALKCFSLFPK